MRLIGSALALSLVSTIFSGGCVRNLAIPVPHLKHGRVSNVRLLPSLTLRSHTPNQTCFYVVLKNRFSRLTANPRRMLWILTNDMRAFASRPAFNVRWTKVPYTYRSTKVVRHYDARGRLRGVTHVPTQKVGFRYTTRSNVCFSHPPSFVTNQTRFIHLTVGGALGIGKTNIRMDFMSGGPAAPPPPPPR